MIHRIHTNGGLIRMIVLILIVLLILAYFGLNLRSIVNSPTFQDNWNFLTSLVVNIWNNFLKVPFDYLWNTIFVPLIWNPAINHLTQMHNDPSSVIATSSVPFTQ